MSLSIDISRNEAAFIEACIAREEWALKALYEEFYSVMLPVCLRYANCESDGLDILHEGFIKVFRHIEKYKPGTSLHAWIRRIMVNCCIDYYRKEARRRTDDISEAYHISSSEPTVVEELNAKQIMRALQQLTPSYRAVFNLYVIEGYPHKEIADKLGITESTSRSNLVKARAKLKEIITAAGRNTL